MQTLELRPLTAEAFKPFGDVTDTHGGARRSPVPNAFERTAEAVEPRLWLATIASVPPLPLTLRTLERHPHSAQTFLPLDAPYIVVVCHSDAGGQPDIATLQAFRATARQGVTYARNVWHHGLTALEAPARFVVSMSFTGAGGDDVFVTLAEPVLLASES
jgi:ureidoglycolate lyase